MPSKSTASESDDENEQGFSGMVCCNFVDAAKSEWIIDSGASDHMTGNVEVLKNRVKSYKNSKINLPTGETAEITCYGEVELKNGISLKQVIYVPSFKHNLLSVQKLIRDEGCKIEFYENCCVIKDGKSDKLKGVGKGQNGLYYLINEPTEFVIRRMKWLLGSQDLTDQNGKCRKLVMTAEKQVDLPQEVQNLKPLKAGTKWHLRMGHTPIRKLKKIKELNSVKEGSDDVCLVCQAAKFTKKTFVISLSRAKEPFELVHFDTWSPYKVQTREGYKYFLTLVDDHSRMTWVHLMKQKNEAFGAVEKFVKMVETQYGRKVKQVRSDNAQEYDDENCREYFARLGIKHQKSCVDTPQQNGRVERKHRNILEMARALRFQASLPKQYWGDCVQTFAHIINRIPSKALSDITPYKESVYMKLPMGYSEKGDRITVMKEENQKRESTKVCKLLKSLYGLKQAPRQWFSKLSQALKHNGFHQSKSDYSLFTKHEGKKFTAILVYVDDLLVASNDKEGVKATKTFLNREFSMKDMGVLRYFLGIEVDRSNEGISFPKRSTHRIFLKNMG